MVGWIRVWLLLFSLLGLGASVVALAGSYRTLQERTLATTPETSLLACDPVYQSRFATVRGVPVALGGVIWFAFATLLTTGSRGQSNRSDLAAYLFLMSVPAVALVLYFAYVSIMVLHILCVWCALTWLGVLGLFAISAATTTTRLPEMPRRFAQDVRLLAKRRLLSALVLLFVATAAGAVAFFARMSAPSAALLADATRQPTEFDVWFESQPRVPDLFPVDGARVLIVAFRDDQCTSCANVEAAAEGVIARYQAAQPGAIAVIRREMAAGESLGVRMPPTYFINGVRLEGAPVAELIESAIAHELRVTAGTR